MTVGFNEAGMTALFKLVVNSILYTLYTVYSVQYRILMMTLLVPIDVGTIM